MLDLSTLTLPDFEPLMLLAVVGLTQMVKKAEIVSNRILPIVAALIGGLSNVYLTGAYSDPNVVIIGVIAGLATAGVYDVVTKKIEEARGE